MGTNKYCSSFPRPAPSTMDNNYMHVDVGETKSITFTPQSSICLGKSITSTNYKDHFYTDNIGIL